MEPRFQVDHMLARLARYLRCAGYDAAEQRDVRTLELIARANAEGRVFLTRNKHLVHHQPRPERSLTLAGDDPVAQFHAVLAALGLEPGEQLFTRCIRCNRLLEPVADKLSLREAVPPRVFERYTRFFSCPSCGTVFWRGSHVSRTCRKLGLPDVAEPDQG